MNTPIPNSPPARYRVTITEIAGGVETEMYAMTVDDLDYMAVVRAINGIRGEPERTPIDRERIAMTARLKRVADLLTDLQKARPEATAVAEGEIEGFPVGFSPPNDKFSGLSVRP